MSNLIKLKQIKGGTALQNDVTKAKSDISTLTTDLGTANTNIATLEGKIGNTSVADQIDAAKPTVHEVTSDSTDIDALVEANNITAKKGDLLVVTSTVNNVKSAYHYNGEVWVACDGNVDATKVILKENITLAGNYTRVGNLTKKDEKTTATFETAGKSVATALQEILSKREQPSITGNPAVTVTLSQAGSYEVGSSVTPSYTASLSTGSYTYGPATGITAKTWSVTQADSDSAHIVTDSKDTASGSFTAFTVGDNTNYTVKAVATYDAGVVAVDNLGSASNPTIQIAAGSKENTSSSVTGYRSWFIYIGTDNTTTIDSAFIRSNNVANKGSALDATGSTYAIPAGTKRVMIALPKAGTVGRNTYSKKLTSCIDVDGMGLDQYAAGKFVESTVSVEGANSYDGIDYTVYTLENANGLAATNFTLTIA